VREMLSVPHERTYLSAEEITSNSAYTVELPGILQAVSCYLGYPKCGILKFETAASTKNCDEQRCFHNSLDQKDNVKNKIK